MVQKFFAAPENTVFLWALAILFILSLLIVSASLLGALNLPESDADLEVDWDTDSVGANLLEFLGISAMPLSIFVLVASCTFFVSGYTIQMVVASSRGSFLPGIWVILPSLVITAVTCRWIGKGFAKVKFKLDTSAVSQNSFLYQTATISQGVARAGLAAEAKLTDSFGQTHIVLVEPSEENVQFEPGTSVVLIENRGNKFIAVNPETI